MSEASALESKGPLRPVAGIERYAALDVLRGLALFGVLMINLDMCFRNSFAAYAAGERNCTTSADHVVSAILVAVLQLKAFTLFSFSFGVGMAVQTDRATPRRTGVRWFLVRRLVVLLALGTCHMFLIWNGDILMLYAVCGLLALPFVRARPVVLALAGVAAITLNFVFQFGSWLPANEAYPTIAAEAARVHADGNYFEILRFHAWEAVHLSLPCLASVLPRTLGLMLLGMAAWRSGLLREPERHRLVLAGLVVLGLVVGGVSTAATQVDPAYLATIGVPMVVFEACSYIPLALAYAAGVFLCLGSSRVWWVVRPFAALGQMALTNYLTQSVVLGFIFFGYGLGLQGKLGPAMASLIGISLYAVQLIVSPLWLSRFQFGPVEWLWRSLTYGRMQPIRRVRAGAIGRTG